jgi:hypothetical protein
VFRICFILCDYRKPTHVCTHSGVSQIDRIVEAVSETLKGNRVHMLKKKSLPRLDLPKVNTTVMPAMHPKVIRRDTQRCLAILDSGLGHSTAADRVDWQFGGFGADPQESSYRNHTTFYWLPGCMHLLQDWCTSFTPTLFQLAVKLAVKLTNRAQPKKQRL